MRSGLRFRGSPRRLREIERSHSGDGWRILVIMLAVEIAAVLTWAVTLAG